VIELLLAQTEEIEAGAISNTFLSVCDGELRTYSLVMEELPLDRPTILNIGELFQSFQLPLSKEQILESYDIGPICDVQNRIALRNARRLKVIMQRAVGT
jgi:hypothetical protein